MSIPFEIETARSAMHFVLAMLVVIALGLRASKREDDDEK
jgi:hypothetical protein